MEFYADMLLADDPGQLVAEYGVVPELAEDAEYVARASLQVGGANRYGISAVAFDKYEELVWCGNQGGYVTSCHGPEMQRYTAFRVHAHEEVRHLATLEAGVLALTATTLRLYIRRGLNRQMLESPHMQDMQCMLPTHDRLLLGGHQAELLQLDLTTWQPSVVGEEESGCAVLRCGGGSLVACGGAGGEVALRDLRSPARATHRLRAHDACLSDLDFQGDLLITAGFTSTSGGHAVAESVARVWDVRRLGSGSGRDDSWCVQLPIAPLLLHFVPAVSGRAAAAAADGSVVLFHVHGERDVSLFQVETEESSACTVFDISATSQALTFGDAAGRAHLYSATRNEEPAFNAVERATEFAASPRQPAPVSISEPSFRVWNAPKPQVRAGEAYFHQLPDHITRRVYRKPDPVDPNLIASMKMKGPIGYAPNPRTKRRNQFPYSDTLPAQAADSMEASARADPRHSSIPKHYHKMDPRVSGGVAGLPGLEATLANSYCNAMLQVLYHSGALKNTLAAHACAREFCLSCELRALFRALDAGAAGAAGAPTPCSAASFLRAFRTVPEAAALGLVLPERDTDSTQRADRVALVQSWARFMLHQLHRELAPAAADVDAHESPVTRLFGVVRALHGRCLKCDKQAERRSVALECALQYPGPEGVGGAGGGVAALLEAALAWRRTTPAWCETCTRFSPTAQRASLRRLPPLLAINFGGTRMHERRYWDKEGGASGSAGVRPCRYGAGCSRVGCRFQHPARGGAACALPLELAIRAQPAGDIVVTEEASGADGEARYALSAMVVSVQRRHLVAYVRLSSGWTLFNDVNAVEVSAEEVVEFASWWKTPCVLLYSSGEDGQRLAE